MRSLRKSAVVLAVLIGGLWLGVKPASAKAEYSKKDQSRILQQRPKLNTPTKAKAEYSKKEKKSCTFCQVATGKPDLSDAGKYYKEHDHSLEGYQPNE